MLKVADTRFASSFIMLKRLREVKAALGAIVISKFWSFCRKTDQAASKKVEDSVLDDVWWERIDLAIKIMDPIIYLLRFADTNQPICYHPPCSCLCEVDSGWMVEGQATKGWNHNCLDSQMDGCHANQGSLHFMLS